MGNALFQAICRTGIFMICAQAITHFRPQESYEKYLKLLVSTMVLIQIFIPLGNFAAGFGKSGLSGQLSDFQASLEQSMEEARKQAEETDKMLEEMTLEEVRRRMEEQAMQNAGQQAPEQEQPRDEQGETNASVYIQNINIEIDPIEQITAQ